MRLSFDFDGTLVSSDAKQQFSMQISANRLGLQIDAKNYWQLKRGGAGNLEALNLLDFDERVAKKLSKDWLKIIESPQMSRFDQLQPGTMATLRELNVRGHQLTLISARKDFVILSQELTRLRIDRYFKDVNCVSPDSPIEDKERILKANNADGYFGDSEVDLLAAKKAEVPFYALTCGQRSENFLRSFRYGQLFSSISQAVSVATSSGGDFASNSVLT